MLGIIALHIIHSRFCCPTASDMVGVTDLSELRKNLLSGQWVIVSTGGTGRLEHPHGRPEAGQGGDGNEAADYDPKCPFCRGNEHMTLPEVSLVKAEEDSESPDWIARVVPSSHPALRPVGEPVVRRHHIHQYISGVGSHEIVAESPQHNIEPYDQPLDRFAAVIATYRDRTLALEGDRRFEYVSVFRNRSRVSEAVSRHPRSEILAMPLVPMSVENELEQSKEYYDFSSSCVLCDLIKDELSAGIRVVLESDEFVAITPYAARVPFETWIVPTRHSCAFATISDSETKALARTLAHILLVLAEDLGDPAYTYHIHTAPARVTGLDHYHWHLELIPRVSASIGLEHSTGIYVNPMSPEDNAAFLNRRLTVT